MVSICLKIAYVEFVLGTGLRIGDVYRDGSKIIKAAKNSQRTPVLIISNTWKTTLAIQNYICSYLGTDQILNDVLCSKLIGRVRPVALFVEQCLVNFDCIDFEVNKYFILTTKR